MKEKNKTKKTTTTNFKRDPDIILIARVSMQLWGDISRAHVEGESQYKCKSEISFTSDNFSKTVLQSSELIPLYSCPELPSIERSVLNACMM